jgi:hypothetical protein
MCDYSLEHYQNRPARKGEPYETTRFTSGSIGFIAPGNHSVAICMACDTRLTIQNVPLDLQRRLSTAATETVTFVRLDAGLYRDGVRFDNGKSVSLQELGVGVKATLEDEMVEPLPELGPQAQWQIRPVEVL